MLSMLLVCVMADGQALQLVQHACQNLRMKKGTWRVLHLNTVSAGYAGVAAREDLEKALQMARDAGAQIVHSTLNMNASGHLLAQIAKQADEGVISDVLLGDQATGTVYWTGHGERLSDFAAVLSARVPHVQVHILVAKRNEASATGLPVGKAAREQTRRSWRYWSLPLATLMASTALCFLIAGYLHPTNLILIYLVGVLYVALMRDLVASMVTVLGAILIFDWIFVEPRWSLKPADPEYFFTFAVTLTVGLAVSRLAVRARATAIEALALASRAQSLSLMAQSLSSARTHEEVANTLTQAVERGVGARSRVMFDEALPPEAAPQSQLPSPEGNFRFGLNAAHGALGVLLVEKLPAERQTIEDLQLLQALCDQAAIALERCNADLRSQQAAIEAETERVRNTLLAGISHDFRTPLTAIIGAATTVISQGQQITQPQHDALLHNMLDQAQRLQSLTSDLLDLARLQDDAVRPDCEWCPVDELVSDALALAGGSMHTCRVEVRVTEEDIVWCDARLVTQALTNLLVNAAQHSPPLGLVRVAVHLEHEQWTLSVRDQGQGLVPGHEAEVFRKFHRDATSVSATGTGLGLAICEVVARLHGGSITARNDGGAVFEMRIPWPANEPRPMEIPE